MKPYATKYRSRVYRYEDCLRGEYRKIDVNGCWIWTGRKNSKGYPFYRLKGKIVSLTRESLERKRGEALGKLCALHHCDVPACFNPEHLYAGTQRENMLDCERRGRRNSPNPPITVGPSGVKGITRDNKRDLWVVRGLINGKLKYGGCHKDLYVAIEKLDKMRGMANLLTGPLPVLP